MSLVLALLGARARHAGARWLIVAGTLALAAAVPVVTATLTSTTADAALRRGLESVAPGDRSVVATFNGLFDETAFADADVAVRQLLPRLTTDEPRRQMLFRELADLRGETFLLGAADDLAHAVRVVEGRLPRTCTPTHCEVVQLETGSVTTPTLKVPTGLDVVVVGRVVRADPYLLSGSFDPGPEVAILLADGVLPASRLEPLLLRQRSYGWVAPIDLATLRDQGVGAWTSTAAQVSGDLLRANTRLVLLTPDATIRAEISRAGTSTGRFAVLGGATAIVLLGAAVVGGTALRRDHQSFTNALRRRGAGRRVLRLLLIGEVGLAAFAGATLGLGLGILASVAIARPPGPPTGSTVSAAVGTALPAVIVLTLVASLLLAGTLRLNPPGPGAVGRRSLNRALEAAVLTLAGVAVLLLARGGVSTAGSRAGDPALAALPALVLVCAGLLMARLWPDCARLAMRLLPRRDVAARIGITAVAGRPLRPAATAGLLVAAIGAATFAGGYAATLHEGAADQAAFAVPLDVTLTTGQEPARPLDVATAAVLSRAAGGAEAFAALHATGSLRTGTDAASPVTMIGVDPGALPRVNRWAAVTGSRDSPESLAAALRGTPAAPYGMAVPDGSDRLVIDGPGPGRGIEVIAFVKDTRGRETGVTLRAEVSAGAPGLVGDLPDGDGRRVVAVTVRQTIDAATHTQHALGESERDLDAPSGTLSLGSVTFGSPAGHSAVEEPWTGWTAAGLTVLDGRHARLDYRIATGAVHLRPPGDVAGLGSPLPAVTDRATAATARDDVATVVRDGQPISIRVVAVLDRFPTIASGPFVIADVTSLGRILDTTRPGTGQPDELWLAARRNGGSPRLTDPVALNRLDVRERAVVEQRLRADPVARGATAVLAFGAALTLLVGAAALVLLVVTERRDDAAQTYAWEADGVAPGVLRRSLWWRATMVAVPALVIGLAAGLLLNLLTARLVAVTATAMTPHPPLVASTGGAWGAVAVLAVLLLALGLSALVAGSTLREPLPQRESAVLS